MAAVPSLSCAMTIVNVASAKRVYLYINIYINVYIYIYTYWLTLIIFTLVHCTFKYNNFECLSYKLQHVSSHNIEVQFRPRYLFVSDVNAWLSCLIPSVVCQSLSRTLQRIVLTALMFAAQLLVERCEIGQYCTLF